MRTLLFGAWVVLYVSLLLVARRMWTGKYTRSPLARTLLTNALTTSDFNAQGVQEVTLSSGDFCRFYICTGFGDINTREDSPSTILALVLILRGLNQISKQRQQSYFRIVSQCDMFPKMFLYYYGFCQSSWSARIHTKLFLSYNWPVISILEVFSPPPIPEYCFRSYTLVICLLLNTLLGTLESSYSAVYHRDRILVRSQIQRKNVLVSSSHLQNSLLASKPVLFDPLGDVGGIYFWISWHVCHNLDSPKVSYLKS